MFMSRYQTIRKIRNIKTANISSENITIFKYSERIVTKSYYIHKESVGILNSKNTGYPVSSLRS